MPPRNLAVILFTVVLSLWCYRKADHGGYAAALADAMKKVRMYYVEEIDSRQLFENAMTGMVEDSLDQYSSYIAPDSFRKMEEDLDQEFGGVGIEIEKKEASPLLVLSPLVGSPAYREGLRAGDTIYAIDGESTLEMSRDDCVDRMRGKPGSPVVLKVLSSGEQDPIDVSIVREMIVVQSVLGDTRDTDGSWDFHLVRDPRIGYLRIGTFGKHTVEELHDVIDNPANRDFEALLVDLRHNAGGLLNTAVSTCDLFVGDGRIVSTRGRDGSIGREYDATAEVAVPKEMPIVVLVNGFSASASEIVAACLQDYRRAVIVGERTYGKGTVQNVLEMEGGRSALRLTTATYWRPSGVNIHRLNDAEEDDDWGVRPDQDFEVIVAEDEANQVFDDRRNRDIHRDGVATEGEEDDTEPRLPVEDRQLKRALEYLQHQLEGTERTEVTETTPLSVP